ncbi:hypothetical protein [Flavobacterium sp. U410]
MRYLKITFVRVLLSFFISNMFIALFIDEKALSVPVFSVIYRIIGTGLIYYGLTLYVNNRR